MRQALGNTFIINIVITIVVILIAVVISSLSYSKAFKVKNMIVSTIESNNGFTEKAKSEIDASLKTTGYRVNKNGIQNCKMDDTDDGATSLTNSNSYRYCVIQIATSKGYYYRVASYMYFDLPVIGSKMEFPVYGETKTFYNNYT